MRFRQSMKFRTQLLLLLSFLCEAHAEILSGRPCNPDVDWQWRPEEGEPTAFNYCNRRTWLWQKDYCAVVKGVPKVFNVAANRCVDSFSATMIGLASTGSRKVGDTCQFNTDCVEGGYCNSQFCSCLSGYISYNNYCYSKINPGQAGCFGDVVGSIQCTAVWPNTKCVGGVCKCCDPNNLADAVCNFQIAATRDGTTCLEAAGSCPLGGPASKLAAAIDVIPAVVTCTVTATQTTGCEIDGVSYLYMFDCIDDPATDNDYCCPNRALTCTLPKIGEVATGGELRWWFNPITGACSTFRWETSPGSHTDPQLTNANNFRTQEHCLTYCTQTCNRGNPEYIDNTVQSLQGKRTCSAGSQGCSSNHECTPVGSDSYCCPTTSFICGATGGVIPISGVPPVDGIRNCDVSLKLRAPNLRFRFNPETSKCESFNTYQGCGGTWNNFGSQAECESFCQELSCPMGKPLKDGGGNSIVCGASSQCPSTHSCINGFCCPTKQTVCTQPKMLGTCTSYQARFWFNSVSQVCESFTYSGCQGNDNNFPDALNCQNSCRGVQPEPQCVQGQAYKDALGNFQSCSPSSSGSGCPINYECYFDGFTRGCCPTKAYVCSLSYNGGISCGPRTTRWTFDANSQTCQTFEYLGCDGNPNNFPNQDMCQQYCGVNMCPFGGSPYKEDNGVTRVCGASAGTCPPQHTCSPVPVGLTTVNYCCPSRSFICRQPPQPGTNCGQSVTRYYYNFALNDCTKFTYNGCSGNANRFSTKAQCEEYCQSSACLAGEAVLVESNQPKTCATPNAVSDCPNGYTCRFDELAKKNVCCGSSNSGVCPSSAKSYIDPFEGNPRNCIPSNANSCPGEYVCTFNAGSRMYYCCAPTDGAFCPTNRNPFQDPNTSVTLKCQLNAYSGCPSGYSCSSSMTGALQGYCCSMMPTGSCPTGTVAYKDPRTQQPYTCSVGGTPCPDSRYTCQNTMSGATGFCCTSQTEPDSDLCPNGYNPVLNPVFPIPCVPGAPLALTRCPPASLCLRGKLGAFCCQLDTSGSLCPTNFEVQKWSDTTSPKQCLVGYADACDNGGECLPVAGKDTAFCCKPSTSTLELKHSVVKLSIACPAGQKPYSDPFSKQPLECDPLQSKCPKEYFCQFSSKTQKFFCCTSTGCADGSHPEIGAGTGLPKACTPGTNAGCSVPSYSCQFSSTEKRNLCCKVDIPAVKCPSNVDPLKTPSGQDQTCSSSVPCPQGYGCTAVGSSSVCCPEPESCPQGDPYPGLNPALPATCPCPSGYDCKTVGTRSFCCASKITVCSQPMQTGTSCTGGSPITRYYFNANTGSCLQFIYNGCSGNANRFPTAEDCTNYCLSGVTTPAPTVQLCPIGSSPYYYPGTNDPVSCTLGNPCPNAPSFTCQQGPTGRAYCCSGSVPDYCPSNSKPYITPGTSTPVLCSPGQNCLPGYQCQKGSTGQFYCCSSVLFPTNYCPSNSDPYFFPNTQTPQSCAPGSSACPQTYSCQQGQSGQFYCCKITTPPSYCPENSQPQQPLQACIPGGFNVCQNNYSCRSGLSGSFCCTGAVTPPQYCPANSQAQQPLETCTPGSTTCKDGFSCQQGATANFYCCSGLDGLPYCPNGRTPQQPTQSCVLGSATCNNGFSCQQGPRGMSYCCSGGNQFCPVNTQPQQPLTACVTGGFGTCQTGYSCQQGAGGYFCCSGGTTTQVCPQGVQAQSPVTSCSPGSTNACNNGFSCQLGPTGGYYCCVGSVTVIYCPANSQAQQPVKSCTLGVPSCNPGFSCQTGPNGASSYCCSGGSDQYCLTAESQPQIPLQACIQDYFCYPGYTCQDGPKGFYCCSTPQYCPTGSQAQQPVLSCTAGSNACNPGFSCQQGRQGGFFCCSGGISTQYCPTSSQAQQPIVSCTAGSNTCNQGFSCQQGPQGGYFCCSGGVTTQYCPSSSQAQQPIVSCTAGSNTCNQGFSCQQGPQGGYFCCSGGVTTQYCPASSQAQQPIVSCTAGSNTCNQGFSCQQGPQGGYFCCSGGVTPQYCPSSSQAQQPIVSCTVGSTTCNQGFSCQQGPQGGYFCCSGGVTPQYCPSSSQAQQPIVSCTVGSTTCNQGFSCQQGPQGGFFCCSGGVTPQYCPSSSQAQQPVVSCTAGSSTCNQGFSCQQGPQGGFFCCSGGVTPQYCPSSSQAQQPIVSCSVGSNTCNQGFSCQQGLQGGYFCCSGGETPKYCPTSSQAQEPIVSCTIGSNVCNQGFSCQQGPQGGFFCCSGGQYCPSNTQLEQPRKQCNLGSTVCGTGFSCQQGPQGFYCCSTGSGPLCPANSQPQQPVISCAPGSTSCNAGYSCQGSGTAYCCSDSSQVCPANSTPQQPVLACLPGSSICSSGFSCQAGLSGRSFCCSVVTPVQPCPTGTTPQQPILSCNPAQNTCSTGYSCSAGPSGQYYCCSQPASVCPANVQPQQPVLACTVGVTACNNGYSCQTGPTGKSYCCFGGTVAQNCPAGTQEQQPLQACTVATGCQAGYSCQQGPTGRSYCCSGLDPSLYCPPNVKPQTPTTACNPNSPTQCSNGYNCVQGGRSGGFYCCQGTAANVCPENSSPQEPRQSCTPGGANFCSTGYSCQQGSTGQYFCCSGGALCPDNATPQQPALQCTPGVTLCAQGYTCKPGPTGTPYCCPGTSVQYCPQSSQRPQTPVTSCVLGTQTCQSGYSCQRSPSGTAYCCSEGAQNLCPANTTPQQPMTACTVGVTNCNSGFTCQTGPTGVAYCCSGGAPIEYCPQNSQPQLPLIACNVGSTVCSAGYQCVQGPSQGSYCCSSVTPPINYCPSNSQPQQPPTRCSFGVTTCSTGYGCLTGPSGSSYCCSIPAQFCPTGTQSQEPVAICVPGATVCSVGYSCQSGPTGRSYCCSGGCPDGTQPQNPPTQCVAGGTTTCAPGYSCQSGSGGQSFCCSGGPTIQYCPPNTQAQTPLVACVEGVTTCSQGYSCQRGLSGRSFCCSGGSEPSICPAESEPQTPTRTCLPGSQGSCASGYTCQGSNNRYYCCSTPKIPNVFCPDGRSPYMIPGTTSALQCSPTYSICQAGYSCERSPSSSFYYCCRSSTISTQYCPPGTSPFLYPGTQLPLTCTVGRSVCPTISTCQRGAEGRGFCCMGGSSPTSSIQTERTNDALCPEVIRDKYCTPGTNECPVNNGFTCGYNTQLRSYRCCLVRVSRDPWGRKIPRRKVNCPSGQLELLNPITRKHQCLSILLPGQSGCVTSNQCAFPGASCTKGACRCPPNLLIDGSICTPTCRSGFISQNGACVELYKLFSKKRVIYDTGFLQS